MGSIHMSTRALYLPSSLLTNILGCARVNTTLLWTYGLNPSSVTVKLLALGTKVREGLVGVEAVHSLRVFTSLSTRCFSCSNSCPTLQFARSVTQSSFSGIKWFILTPVLIVVRFS